MDRDDVNVRGRCPVFREYAQQRTADRGGRWSRSTAWGFAAAQMGPHLGLAHVLTGNPDDAWVPDLLPLGRADVLFGAAQERLPRIRDRARAAADAA